MICILYDMILSPFFIIIFLYPFTICYFNFNCSTSHTFSTTIIQKFEFALINYKYCQYFFCWYRNSNTILTTICSVPRIIVSGLGTDRACGVGAMIFYSKDQLFLYLLPEYVKNLPKRNYIVWILTIYKYWRVAYKKKRHEFAVASLCNGFLCNALTSLCNDYVHFKNVIWKYFINKDVCFCFCFSCLLMFRNKTTIYLDDGKYWKTSARHQRRLSRWEYNTSCASFFIMLPGNNRKTF